MDDTVKCEILVNISVNVCFLKINDCKKLADFILSNEKKPETFLASVLLGVKARHMHKRVIMGPKKIDFFKILRRAKMVIALKTTNSRTFKYTTIYWVNCKMFYNTHLY